MHAYCQFRPCNWSKSCSILNNWNPGSPLLVSSLYFKRTTLFPQIHLGNWSHSSIFPIVSRNLAAFLTSFSSLKPALHFNLDLALRLMTTERQSSKIISSSSPSRAFLFGASPSRSFLLILPGAKIFKSISVWSQPFEIISSSSTWSQNLHVHFCLEPNPTRPQPFQFISFCSRSYKLIFYLEPTLCAAFFFTWGHPWFLIYLTSAW